MALSKSSRLVACRIKPRGATTMLLYFKMIIMEKYIKRLCYVTFVRRKSVNM